MRSPVVALLLLVASDALAGDLSIEDALRRAHGVSEDVTIAEAAVSRATGATWTARSAWLPTLNGSVAYQHTFASEFDGLFESPDPSAPAIDLPFGRDNTYRIDFTASQTVWAGGRLRSGSRIATAGREIAWLGAESTRADVALDVASAYYDAVLADRLLQIAEETLAQAEATLARTEALRANESESDFNVLRARVEVETQRVAVIQQRRARESAHLRLAQLLDVPPGEELVLTSTLGDDDAQLVALATEVAAVDPVADGTPRAAVRQVEESVRISESSLRITRAGGYPSLSLSASYGWVSYPVDALPPSDLGLWRDNFTAGVALQVPLFNGGRVRGDILSAQADLYEARARAEQTTELVALDSADAQLQLEAAVAQWDATATTVEQAERAYAIAEVRFEEGISSQLELSDARLMLQRALATRAQAARDLQVARIRIALLPWLPVQAAAGMPF